MLHYIISLIIFILYIVDISYAHVEKSTIEEECRQADSCRHNQVPICGIDICGEMRTFIDDCDMHEFNCDSQKDFVPKPAHECWVTCKRGRSFKKPEFGGPGCDDNKLG